MELELVKRFKDIFTGLERAHGVFEKKNEPQEGKKVEAHMMTVHEAPSIEKFERHLQGEYPAMGIVPINDDDQCKFGAIDIDVYPLDHKALLKQIKQKLLQLDPVPIIVYIGPLNQQYCNKYKTKTINFLK